MRITSKGQVTIPQRLRSKFGLLPNTQVNFEEGDGCVMVGEGDGCVMRITSKGQVARRWANGRSLTNVSAGPAALPKATSVPTT